MTCLMAWRRNEESADAYAGAFVTAELMLLIRGALTKKASKAKKR